MRPVKRAVTVYRPKLVERIGPKCVHCNGFGEITLYGTNNQQRTVTCKCREPHAHYETEVWSFEDYPEVCSALWPEEAGYCIVKCDSNIMCRQVSFIPLNKDVVVNSLAGVFDNKKECDAFCKQLNGEG